MISLVRGRWFCRRCRGREGGRSTLFGVSSCLLREEVRRALVGNNWKEFRTERGISMGMRDEDIPSLLVAYRYSPFAR